MASPLLPRGAGALFSTDLRGGGSGPFAVRVAFSNSSLTPGVRVDQIDYPFDNTSPVPEPGSLLLFGSGATWLAAREMWKAWKLTPRSGRTTPVACADVRRTRPDT